MLGFVHASHHRQLNCKGVALDEWHTGSQAHPYHILVKLARFITLATLSPPAFGICMETDLLHHSIE
jgi:hypothetical protein